MAWKDKEKAKAYYKAYRQKNKEKVKAYRKDYYKANKKKVKAYYQENKDKALAAAANSKCKKKYGITSEQKMEMVINQNSKCLICGEPFLESKNTCVDHCHKTGKVRGILCSKCNSGLGYFKDDINILRNALEYLEKNGG